MKKIAAVLGLLWMLDPGCVYGAEIVPEALLMFPAATEYLECDNLAALRTLRNYDTLKRQFSGKPLEETKWGLARLGIEESQVSELVVGSSSASFYGLLAGTFNPATAAAQGRRQGFEVKGLERPTFCPGNGTCIMFLEDSQAVFGRTSELKQMLETRQGIGVRLSAHKYVVELLNGTDRRAPVRGMLCGSQLRGSLSDMLRDWSGWKRDWAPVAANVNAVGYSVKFDAKAHVSARLECVSKTAAGFLVQVLSAAGHLQGMTGGGGFENLQASATGNAVEVKLDGDIASMER